jgi:hypothetical protein
MVLTRDQYNDLSMTIYQDPKIKTSNQVMNNIVMNNISNTAIFQYHIIHPENSPLSEIIMESITRAFGSDVRFMHCCYKSLIDANMTDILYEIVGINQTDDIIILIVAINNIVCLF